MDVKSNVIVNAAWNVAGRFAIMLVGMFLTPFIIGGTGAKAAGIVTLIVYSVLPYLEIFAGGIATSVGRYVTLHQARGETDEANRYFNTSLFTLVGLCAVASLPILLLSLYFPQIFNVEKGLGSASRWTMLLASVGFVLTAISSPFGVGLYYRQRFDLRNVFDVTASLAKAGTVVLLFSFVQPSVVYVGVGMVVAASIQALVNVVTAYRMVPGLQTSSRLFSRDKLRDVSEFSFYLVVSRVSMLLLVSTDNILINWLYGQAAVTTYNLGAVWFLQLRGFVMAAAFVLGPLVTILDATSQYDRIRAVFLRGTRLMVLILCPIVVFFCALGKPFMHAWMHRAYRGDLQPAVHVLWTLLLPSVITLSVMPAFTMFTAMGRVRAMALVTFAVAVANVGFSIWLAKGVGLGILGIALGTIISLFLKNTAFIPWYMCRLCNARLRDFFRVFPAPIVATFPGAAFAILIQRAVNINNWFAILGVGMVSFLSYCVVVYLWCLREEDKRELFAVWSQIRKAFSREQNVKRDKNERGS